MEVLLFGGFLGSGKTTVINALLHDLTALGKTAAIVENEIGAVGIDDVLVAQTGLKVTPLFGGCVCCQLTADLLTAVHTIEDQVHPDVLVVEMTGLAMMDGIRDTFARYGRDTLRLHTIAVVDMARWTKLIRAMEPVVRRQLAGADLVLVNKTDVVPADLEALERMSQLAGGSPCRTLSARDMAPGSVLALIREVTE